MDLGDYRLLCHWSNVLSSLLSVAPTVEENPFHQHLTPMVNDAAGPLRYTVLFMAAEHLAALHGQQSWETQTLHYHNLAIRSLSEALQDPNEAASDSTLATVLLMQLSTYFASDQDPRASHLVAAECIIRKRWSSSSWDSPCWRFLLSLFRYRDIMSSISDGSRPLLYGYAAAAVESEQLLGGITSLLELISQISVLQSQKKSIMTTADDEPSDFPFLAVASALETELGRWTAPSSEPDWVNTAEAYRHATFIYLYRVIYNIGTPHPVTIRHVQRCRDALRAVPVESPLTSVHVWPLFTAGCESSDLADRAFYRQRLKDMYDHRKLRSLARVRMAMEDVWVQKDTEAQRGLEHVFQLDCIDVLKQRGRVIELG
ncbi:C6 transcription factor [Aspergillus sclerotialis]|uniref:C6 transcription factor n=1 Tax=Aspergillus sclerotialis TaxID=2070753 RepID=A0A3A2ZMS1_9EURO|nr:C6 transcription factor [Aspergillus sclerotialis]